MPNPPNLEFVMELHAQLEPPLDLGMTPAGHRRMVGIRGGRFEGPAMRGEILAGGADWQVLRSDGVMVVEARVMTVTSAHHDSTGICARRSESTTVRSPETSSSTRE